MANYPGLADSPPPPNPVMKILERGGTTSRHDASGRREDHNRDYARHTGHDFTSDAAAVASAHSYEMEGVGSVRDWSRPAYIPPPPPERPPPPPPPPSDRASERVLPISPADRYADERYRNSTAAPEYADDSWTTRRPAAPSTAYDYPTSTAPSDYDRQPSYQREPSAYYGEHGRETRAPSESYARPPESHPYPRESYGRPDESYPRPHESYPDYRDSYSHPRESYPRPHSSPNPYESYPHPRESYPRPHESYPDSRESYPHRSNGADAARGPPPPAPSAMSAPRKRPLINDAPPPNAALPYIPPSVTGYMVPPSRHAPDLGSPVEEQARMALLEMKQETAFIDQCPPEYSDNLRHARRLLREECYRLDNDVDPDWVEVDSLKPIRVTKRVLIPLYKYPHVNFVGKILGTKGANAHLISKKYKCQLAVLGAGTTKDRQREEQLLRTGDPRYAHFGGPAHVRVETVGAAYVAHMRMAAVLNVFRRLFTPGGKLEIDGVEIEDTPLWARERGHEAERAMHEADRAAVVSKKPMMDSLAREAEALEAEFYASQDDRKPTHSASNGSTASARGAAPSRGGGAAARGRGGGFVPKRGGGVGAVPKAAQ
ncbi:KH domain-containing protein [Aphelenchoides avenae]|nr:KH domain-containing protein [Aphelenchus avenae]